MNAPLTDLTALLSGLQPQLNDGVFVFVALPVDALPAGMELLATFREREGWSAIASEHVAQAQQWNVQFRAAWITLNVNSDLHAVGLTAAVSTALADAGITCNVVAAIHHDHLFVAHEHAQAAMQVLQRLQQRAASRH